MDIYESARNGDIDDVKIQLETGLVEIHETDGSGNTLLHHAVLGNSVDMVNYLVTVPGINMNATNNRGQTPMFLAVENKFQELAVILMENGAEIEDAPSTNNDRYSNNYGNNNYNNNNKQSTRSSNATSYNEYDNIEIDVDNIEQNYFDESTLNDFEDFMNDMETTQKESIKHRESRAKENPFQPRQSSSNKIQPRQSNSNQIQPRQSNNQMTRQSSNNNNNPFQARSTVSRSSQAQLQEQFDDLGDELLNDIDNISYQESQPQREQRRLVQYSTGLEEEGLSMDSSLSAVDDLLDEMQGHEGSILAHETDLIVNWDTVSNCLIEFISIFSKTTLGTLNEKEKSDLQELADYYLMEVKANWEKFPFWLVTLDNENVVSLHTCRNQTKESAETMMKAISQYNQLPNQPNQRALLTRVQTVVADCWCFYEAMNLNWGYDSVVFAEIENFVKVVKRFFAAAKCESGEDWTSVCLESLQAALKVERIGNFVAYSKKNLNLQIDISNCSIMLTKIIKRAQAAGDEHRKLPNPKTRNLIESLSKAFVTQVKELHTKIRVPAPEPKAVVYTNEVMTTLASGYKQAAKSVLDSIDTYTNMFGTSLDVDVQELIELGEFITKNVAKMAELFRAIPLKIVENIMGIAFNISKIARVVVKWAELPTTDQKTRDLLLSTMQTALNYSIQAKCISALKAASYPILEIESSLFTACRGLCSAISNIYDSCCFLNMDAQTPNSEIDENPNAVSIATAQCMHYGRRTPMKEIETKKDVFDEILPQGDGFDNATQGDGFDAFDVGDILDEVNEMDNFGDLNTQVQEPEPVKEEPKPQPPPEEEEELPPLEPLPSQPPSLSDIEGYKNYMRLKYEHQQRENALLLREMKRKKALENK